MVKKNLLRNVKKLGVDGLIIVDLPWPDNKIFSKISFDVFDNLIFFILLILALTSSADVDDHMLRSKLFFSGSYKP